MLTVVDGKLLNTRDVGNAVATMLLNGIPIDQVCDTPGMPTPTQIAWMRRNDPAFSEAMTVAFEGAGIEAAMTLVKGARGVYKDRDGNRQGLDMSKHQTEAAMWVAERMAPELFQERKTVTTQEITLTDEELAYQLQSAARSDERVRRILQTNDDLQGILLDPQHNDGSAERPEMSAADAELTKKMKPPMTSKQERQRATVKKLFSRRRGTAKSNASNT